MYLDLNFFSCLTYVIIAIFFISVFAVTVQKWIRNEFISMEFPLAVSASSVCIFTLVVSDVVRFGNVSGYILSDIGFAAMPMFVLLVSDGGKVLLRNASVAILSISFVYVAFHVVFPPSSYAALDKGGLLTVVAIFISILVIAEGIRGRIADMRTLINHSSLYSGIEDMVNLVYLLILLMCQVTGAIVGSGTDVVCRILTVQCLVLMLGLYACVYWRLLTGRVFLLFKSKDTELREVMQACTADLLNAAPKEDICYKIVFDRLVEYFDKEKPFLDGNLNIADVSRTLLTNKAYLSRAINKYTGRNFCQYVNYYRIKHSVQLFSTDPNLKIADLASRSGFHSLVTFGMAFRLYMNVSPGEWCRKNREIMLKKP